MNAYKFLGRDRTSAMTRFQWPDAEWVETDGPIERCRTGIHACRIEHLPHWIGPELWSVELDGEIVEAADAALDAAAGWVSATAYIAAAVAGEVASGSRRGALYQHYFLAERTRQAWWLQDRLSLSD